MQLGPCGLPPWSPGLRLSACLSLPIWVGEAVLLYGGLIHKADLGTPGLAPKTVCSPPGEAMPGSPALSATFPRGIDGAEK